MATKQTTKDANRSVASSVATSLVQDQLEEFTSASTWKEMFFQGVALAAVGTSAAAIVIEGGPIVSAVSSVCAFLGPCAAIQQNRLTDLETMRTLQNKLREEVNSLRQEVVDLRQENDRLEASAERLREVEGALEEISKQQGQSVDSMVKQVEEFREIQEEIKMSLEAKIVQNLISIIMDADVDDDNILDPEEVDGLLMRLHLIEGVEFNEANFKRAVEKSGLEYQHGMEKKGGYSLKLVMKVVKNMISSDKKRRDSNVFQINPEGLLKKTATPKQEVRKKPPLGKSSNTWRG